MCPRSGNRGMSPLIMVGRRGRGGGMTSGSVCWSLIVVLYLSIFVAAAPEVGGVVASDRATLILVGGGHAVVVIVRHLVELISRVWRGHAVFVGRTFEPDPHRLRVRVI